jgi:hypothetical protein
MNRKGGSFIRAMSLAASRKKMVELRIADESGASVAGVSVGVGRCVNE